MKEAKRKPPEELERNNRTPGTTETVKKKDNALPEREPEAVRPAKQVVVEIPRVERSRHRPKATVEEVEDSEDERDLGPPRQEFPRELPYRDVQPLREAPPPEVLPRRLGKENQDEPKTVGRRKRTPKDTKVEEQATARLLENIRKTVVTVEIGDLIDSNPKIQKAFEPSPRKSRRANFVKTSEGGVLATKVQNFMVQRVSGDDDDSPEDDSEGPETEESSVRLVETDIMTYDASGKECSVLLFDTYPEIVTTATHNLAEGSVIIGDPVQQYFESLGPGIQPMDIKVPMAVLSGKLRCLYPMINGIAVEAINDMGSQIVSMNLKLATTLNLKWDPTITILMQAANDQYQRTEGLAKNVPFVFEGILLYLQVHILRSAPYQVLLGRPFEMLAETIVASKRNGDVAITITDPMSGKQSTIPTYPRGTRKCLDCGVEQPEEAKQDSEESSVPQDFRSSSMNSRKGEK